MEYTDTEELLRECDSGTKMAVSSIDEVLDMVGSERLKGLLCESKSHHARLGNRIHEMINRSGVAGKDPNPVAKSMSWVKTNVKMSLSDSDATIADLMTDGCNMGVKSLSRYLNKYSAADEKAKSMCGELIKIEEQLSTDLRSYL